MGLDYFDDKGRWRSVEHATMHAIVVQGGFTTDAIEAERMANERGDGEDAEYLREMGRAWLAEHADA